MKKEIIGIAFVALKTWIIFVFAILFFLALCYIVGLDAATWELVWTVGIPGAAKVWAFASFLYFLILLHQEHYYRDLKRKGIDTDGTI